MNFRLLRYFGLIYLSNDYCELLLREKMSPGYQLNIAYR